MALPLPTDDAELFAALLASLQTDDAAPLSADSSACPTDSADPTASAGPTESPATNDGGPTELLDGDAAELLDALYEPLLALDDRLTPHSDGAQGDSESGRACAGPEEAAAATIAAETALAPATNPKAKKRVRKTNPNKAREEQRRELLLLRARVVEMERQVTTLQARSAAQVAPAKLLDSDDASRNKDEAGGIQADEPVWTGVGLTDVWRQTCLQQIERRVKAERENARLKRALASQLEMTSAIQAILQKPSTPQARDALDASKRRRTSVPLGDTAIDMEQFAPFVRETDSSVGRIDDFLGVNGMLGVDAPCRGTKVREVDGRIVLDVFATSILPHDWRFSSRGAWEFYKGSRKHYGPVFGKTAQSVGLAEDTVLESFVMEISAGDARADFRIRQSVKRYDEAEQQTIAWTLDSQPTELSNKSTNFGFRENGFVVCRPPRTWPSEHADAPPPVTIMQIGYRISPYMAGSRGQHLSLRANIDDIAQFMFTSLDTELRAKLERIENLLLDEKLKN